MGKIQYNDNGAIRDIRKVMANKDGTVCDVQKVVYNDNGTLRTIAVYPPSSGTIEIHDNGAFSGTSPASVNLNGNTYSITANAGQSWGFYIQPYFDGMLTKKVLASEYRIKINMTIRFDGRGNDNTTNLNSNCGASSLLPSNFGLPYYINSLDVFSEVGDRIFITGDISSRNWSWCSMWMVLNSLEVVSTQNTGFTVKYVPFSTIRT